MLDRIVYMPIETVAMNAALARPVRDPMGRLLAGEGQLLSDRLRVRLQQRGVTLVPVHDPRVASKPHAHRQALERTFDHLFRHWRLTPGMLQLRRILTEHRLEAAQ